MRASTSHSLWLLVAALSACNTPPAPAQETPATRIAHLAAPVRSIDPTDTDFSDLAPLQTAVGNARVVLLGEVVHGEVPVSRAKTRLVRFFHERMGFDVLVFESGLWDCARMDEALRAGTPVDDAIAIGLFPVVAADGQLRPLMAYARETHATARPLTLAGFDPQLSGIGRVDAYKTWLLAFFDRMGPELLGPADREALSRAFARYPKTKKFHKLTPEERSADRAVFTGLLARLRASAPAHGEREIAFAERTLLDAISLYDWHEAVRADVSTTIDWNRSASNGVRDRQSADNLLWLAREREAGKKLLVWAHNGHIARDVSGVEVPGNLYTYEGYHPMGSLVAEALGEGAYSLAFAALESGRGGATTPAPEGSLEALLGASGAPQAFLDYRAPARDPKHWIHDRITARPTGYVNAVADWTRVFDGVFFIRSASGGAAAPMEP